MCGRAVAASVAQALTHTCTCTYVSSNTNRPEALLVHANTTNATHCTHLSIENECVARTAPQVDDIYSTPKTIFARHCCCRCRRMAVCERARRIKRAIRTRKLPRLNTLNFSVVSMRFIRQALTFFALVTNEIPCDFLFKHVEIRGKKDSKTFGRYILPFFQLLHAHARKCIHTNTRTEIEVYLAFPILSAWRALNVFLFYFRVLN